MPSDNKAVRRYHAGIDRALGLFDATSEWADFIAYLSRLLKALQEAPAEADLPMKATIAQHLAQCLRPSLPSGVHQKALEVYALIFTIIGPQGLAEDLPLYLPGLSHTLSFASLSTRPQLLSIYDVHILELNATVLRPAMRALILSLLPGLEEGSGEDFERTMTTFNRLRTKLVNEHIEEIFWQNLFLASITAPIRRAGVLMYLTKHLPKLSPVAEASLPGNGNHSGVNGDCIVKPEPGLLVRCFATGLQDEQPLIQRGFLDLLVSHLPLDASIFHQGKHLEDLDILVRSAAMVVLRRDMSLNRRLWAWFSGSEQKSSHDSGSQTERDPSKASLASHTMRTTEYFSKFGLQSLVRGIHFLLDVATTQPAVKAQPFRVALSLMDRWEIGGPVVEAVFVPLIQSLQTYQMSAPSQEAFDEVFRSANVFFDGIEGGLVTSQILKLLDQDDLDSIFFILSNFNLEEDEMIQKHVPLICLCIAQKLNESLLESETSTSSNRSELGQVKTAQTLDELLKLLGPDTLIDTDAADKVEIHTNWRDQISQLYQFRSTTYKSTSTPFTKQIITKILISNLCKAYLVILQEPLAESQIMAQLTYCIETYLGKTKGFLTIVHLDFVGRILGCILNDTIPQRRYEVMVSVTRILGSLWINDTEREALTEESLSQFIPILVTELWGLLHPSTPQYHVEVAESIRRLHGMGDRTKLVESTILSVMAEHQNNGSLQRLSVLRFASLWTHIKAVHRQNGVSQSGAISRTNDEAPELLHQPLLFLIDSAKNSYSEESFLFWVRSLTSAGVLFRITFDAANEDLTDHQVLGIAVERLSCLISLVKNQPSLWQSFCEQAGQGAAVLEFCSLILSKEGIATTLGARALNLIQIMVKNGQYQVGEDFTRLLITQFAATNSNHELQGALLETLQVVFAPPSGPELSEQLLPILLDQFASSKGDGNIDKFVALMCGIVPSLAPGTLMANLLKITSHLCKRLDAYFSILQNLYNKQIDHPPSEDVAPSGIFYTPERSIPNLLAGMEYILARAHHQTSIPSEQANGPSGSSLVDLPSSRSSANDHLTVVLCMQDVLKSCVAIWLWRASTKAIGKIVDPKSLHYMSSKFRVRTRRILENLIEAEPQECLETLMGLWVQNQKTSAYHSQILDLLQTLDGARPKFMMPATFGAIYNRTNPAALDKSQRSSLSVDVNAFELIAFLNDYTSALEDDLLDEIWEDCTTFLKEILGNPMPHRQILLKLLEFLAVLCSKMDNTSFGEESRMRRDLADMCARLFTAIFTIKPNGLDGSGSLPSKTELIFSKGNKSSRPQLTTGSAMQILHRTLPDLVSCLSHSDRLMPVYIGIATNITGPMLHAKGFPANVSPELLALLQTMAWTPSATRAWRKDTLDAFNDSRFFQNSHELVELGWLPLIRQLVLTDKAMVFELLNRLTPPAAAGLMFGVGAAAARTDADKRTQLTLRRVILLLLSMEVDSFVPQLQLLFTKLRELLMATADSSPSSTSRCDVYLTFRAILLCFSQSQLSALWPVLNVELRDLCADILDVSSSKFTAQSRLQGAKLLDLLLLLQLDEFQLHEWLFVTDTVDAIYTPAGSQRLALADRIGATIPQADNQLERVKTNASTQQAARKPWLCSEDSRQTENTGALLANFFSQLSIRAFESNYSLQSVDLAACRKDLIADIFAEG